MVGARAAESDDDSPRNPLLFLAPVSAQNAIFETHHRKVSGVDADGSVASQR